MTPERLPLDLRARGRPDRGREPRRDARATSSTLAVDGARGAAVPLPASRTTSRSAATTAPSRVPVRFDARRRRRSSCGPIPTPTSAAASRTAASASTPDAGTAIERVGGDELLFADGRSRRQPFLVLVTAPATRGSASRITGGLIADATRRRPRARPTTTRRRGRVLDAIVERRRSPCTRRPARRRRRARCSDILPWFAHDALDPLPRAARARAVLRRRLGHARRLPGAGRAAARARPHGAAARPAAARLRAPRTPTATGRSGSCSSSASAASAPATRTATSSSGRCSRSRSTCSRPTTPRSSTTPVPFFHPDGDAAAETATRAGARRARARRRSRRAQSRARASPPTATATGTTRCSRPIPAMRERLCSAGR